MPPKNVDLTAPDARPSPDSTGVGLPRRYLTVDGVTAEAITTASVLLPDTSATDLSRPALRLIAGVPSRSKWRKLTGAERRRAFLDSIRSSERDGGRRKGTFKKVMLPAGGRRSVDLSPAIVADLVGRGHIARKPAPEKDGDPNHASVRAPIELSADEASSTLATPAAPVGRSAVTDFEAEADRLSLPLGTAPSDDIALQRLKVVAADASDIFPSVDAAIDFLTARPLDGRGRNGIAILREKGLPGILSSLDQRRFGYSG